MKEQRIIDHLDILQAHSSTAEKVDENATVLTQIQTVIGGELLRHPETGTPLLIRIPDSEHVLWVGHVDVVASDKNQLLKKDTDHWFDRGTFDMKGSIASFMEAFVQSNKPDTVGFLITSDEETGGQQGAKWFFESKKCNRQNIRALLVGEPTNLEIVIDSKGLLVVGIRLFGVSAHASQPWLGVNAASATSELIQLLQKNAFNQQPTRELDWETSMNIGFLNAGNEQNTNTVPSEAELVLDIRWVSKDNPDTIVQSIKSNLSDLRKQSHITDFQLTERMKNLPEHAREDHPIVQNLLESFRQIAGTPVLSKGFGVTDGRHLGNIDNSIPIIRFGPVGGGAHSDNEWVNIRSLHLESKILQHFFETQETV